MGAGFFVMIAIISSIVPLIVPRAWFVEHRLIDGSWLGVAGGTIAGYVLLTFFAYWWHRSVHRFDPLWRLFHQIHHAPHRMDIAGANLVHPLEAIVFTLMNMAVLSLVLGLEPLAVALVGYFSTFAAFFQHWNVRTPQWLGYVIQRPESHCIHHQRGVHGFNYGDLPLWDLLFGTFRNPRDFAGEVGFDSPADRRFARMLAFADVNAPAQGKGSRGVSEASPAQSMA
jgi:sterol desaturase/sphingolipid hydroxylase (fatty acid hydroxylase superfamily)